MSAPVKVDLTPPDFGSPANPVRASSIDVAGGANVAVAATNLTGGSGGIAPAPPYHSTALDSSAGGAGDLESYRWASLDIFGGPSVVTLSPVRVSRGFLGGASLNLLSQAGAAILAESGQPILTNY